MLLVTFLHHTSQGAHSPNCSQCWVKGIDLLHSPETGSGLTGATSQGSLESFHHHHQYHHTHTLFPTPAVDPRVIGRCKSLAPLLQSRATLQWDLNFPQWDQGSHPGPTPSPSLFCFTMVFWDRRLSKSHKLNPCRRITLGHLTKTTSSELPALRLIYWMFLNSFLLITHQTTQCFYSENSLTGPTGTVTGLGMASWSYLDHT